MSASFAATALTQLCKAGGGNSTSGLVACSLGLGSGPCASAANASCDPVFLLRATCKTDAGLVEVAALALDGQNVCSALLPAYCASTGSSLPACTTALPTWPASAAMQTLIAPSCQGLPPPAGCKLCPGLSAKNATVSPTSVAQLVHCDMLSSYMSLCSELPATSAQCVAYAPICATYPSICPTPPATTPPATANMGGMNMGGGGTSTGAMYLHTGISDIVLFASFVPADNWQYLGALVFTFGLCLLEGFLLRVRGMAVKGRIAHVQRVTAILNAGANTSAARKAAEVSRVSEKVLEGYRDAYRKRGKSVFARGLRTVFGVSDVSFVAHQLWKLVLKTLTVLIGYMVMLIVMQFNVGYIVAACLGYGFSSLIFEDADEEVVEEGCCS